MAYIGVSPSNGVRQKHTYTATASQTTFSGAGSEGVSLSYRDSNYVDVYRNGVKLGDADYTATSGTSVVLGEGAAVSDIIEIVTYDVFSVADTVSKADGGTFDGNVAMAGTLDVTGAFTSQGIDDNADATAITIDSSERVGIGITPAFNLHVFQSGPLNSVLESDTGNSNLRITSGDGDSAQIFFGDQTNDTISIIKHDNSDNSLAFFTAGSNERMRITSGGSVGIGNSASGFNAGANNLVVGTGSGSEGITIYADNSSNSAVFFADPDSVTIGQINYQHASNAFTFHTNAIERMRIGSGGDVLVKTIDARIGSDVGSVEYGTSTANSVRFYSSNTERMRIDGSGNFLVGTTSTDDSTDGFKIKSNGQKLTVTRDGAESLVLNRRTSDGDILKFRKDNSAVGSIGSRSGAYMYIGSTSVQETYIGFNNNYVYPSDNDGAFKDNAIDLGNASARYDDIYATNGTIQTSDQNEKNTITDSDLGIDFIKRLTPKSYIFNGKTRTHYGLIAQDVETVLSDISKPTSGFAGFIKSDISEEQDGSEYRYGLRYGEFVAPLIQAVKDQQAIIEDLQARIVALENAE